MLPECLRKPIRLKIVAGLDYAHTVCTHAKLNPSEVRCSTCANARLVIRSL